MVFPDYGANITRTLGLLKLRFSQEKVGQHPVRRWRYGDSGNTVSFDQMLCSGFSSFFSDRHFAPCVGDRT